AANSGAKITLDNEGQVEFIAEKEIDHVLCVRVIDINMGEVIGQAKLAVEYGASLEDIVRTSYPHPTLSETFKDVALAAYFQA
ncbi:uncharacterized protein LAESUDRAFT_621756, partial [Laetiporus sulphureus 93-53]